METTKEIEAKPNPSPEGCASRLSHALAESENAQRQIAFQASLLDQVSDAIVAVDQDFLVTYWNRAAAQLFGRSSQDVLGKDYAEAVRETFELTERNQLRRQLIEQGEIKLEVVCRTQSGANLIVDLSATVLRDGLGRVQGAIGIHRDVTDRRRAEAEQKKNQEQLRILSSAVEQSPVSIVITDDHGLIQYVNPRVSETTGYSLEELIGKNPGILKSGETSPDEYRELWRAIQQGVWRGVFHNKKKNGELFWEAATIGPIRDESGRVSHYLAVKEDITERRAMEQELKFSEERFRVAAESSGDLVYEWDLASDNVKLFGHTAESVPQQGSVFLSSIHQEDQERVRSAIRSNWETGTKYNEEYRIVLPSGEVRHWSDSGSAIRDAAGKPSKWVGVARDVTQAQAGERANAELAAIVESAETAIITRDLEGTVLTWNAGAERIYGYTASEMVGRDLHLTIPSDHMAEAQAINANTRAGERLIHLETMRLAKGGVRIEVLISVSPIRDRAGRVTGAAHLVWDISEFRRLQRQLAHAQKLESVGQLAAGIAHEINTPIQYIGDNAEFLRGAFQDLSRFVLPHSDIIRALRNGPDAVLAESLDRIRHEVDFSYLCQEIPKAIGQLSEGAQQVARIVRAMKEFSHPGSAEKVPLDISRAIQSTILVCKNEWKYVADLTTDFDASLPAVPCLAGEFNQVMLNLIVNAAHAIAEAVNGSGRKGAIHIATRRNDKLAEIRVSDTGTGIPEAIQSKVFDPFFTTKEVGKGTGQGLSIAHGVIVQKHGGRLSFDTQCGVGTTFLIELPLELGAEA